MIEPLTDVAAADFEAVTVDGRRIHVDLRDARAHDLVAADGNLNPGSLALWQHALSAYPWELVVDVGVNYGEMLVGADLPPGARLVGFEPNPAVRALAARTFADNGLDVDLRPHAVADHAGTARFALDPAWSGMSSLAGADGPAGASVLDVEVTTLDDVVPPGVGSFCVKVDVEGFEQQVLEGARGCLARPGPWALMLEVLHMPDGLLHALASRHAVVMLDVATGAPTRVTADEVDDVMTSGRVYAQDCLVLSPSAVDAVVGRRAG